MVYIKYMCLVCMVCFCGNNFVLAGYLNYLDFYLNVSNKNKITRAGK